MEDIIFKLTGEQIEQVKQIKSEIKDTLKNTRFANSEIIFTYLFTPFAIGKYNVDLYCEFTNKKYRLK